MAKKTKQTKQALGRGLSAVFDEMEENFNRELGYDNSSNEMVKEIDVELIKPNPYQPRKNFKESALKELSLSIKQYGLLQPIIVVQKDDEYMLLAGERRLRATKLAKLPKIKAIVADIQSENLRELALIENIQREDLDPIELANAYKELINKHKVTQEELSNIIHKSRAQITNTMRLLNLNERTKALVSEGKISQGHAKILIGLESKDEDTIVDTIIGQKLSVREAENLVKNLKNSQTDKKSTPKTSIVLENIDALKEKFEAFDIKVKTQKNGILLRFENDDEIDEFIKKLNI